MISAEIAGRLAALQNEFNGAGAAAAGAIVGLVIEGVNYARSIWDSFRREYDTLSAQVEALQECCDEIHNPTTPPGRTRGTVVIPELDVQIGTANLAAQAGAGTSPTIAMATLDSSYEKHVLGSFALSITSGTSTAAGDLVRITPATQFKGPVRVTLSPGPGAAGGLIFDHDPYYNVNYSSDGETVSSIDVSVATALTASTAYGIQVKIEPAARL